MRYDDENDSLSSEKRYGGSFGRAGEYVRADGDAGGISVTRYNLILGGVLLWGFLANALICFFTRGIDLAAYVVPILIAYVVLAIVGVLLTRSKSWVVSFIGYNLLVIPLGFVISLYVSGYDPLLLATVFFETAAVTLLMMLLSMIFPRLFLSIGRALLISLLIVIVVELIATVIFVATGSGRESFFFLDWIVVLIFCGYIGYDWAIAQRRQRTVDAAVDSACALYLDIINVFIRLLSIASRRNRR